MSHKHFNTGAVEIRKNAYLRSKMEFSRVKSQLNTIICLFYVTWYYELLKTYIFLVTEGQHSSEINFSKLKKKFPQKENLSIKDWQRLRNTNIRKGCNMLKPNQKMLIQTIKCT